MHSSQDLGDWAQRGGRTGLDGPTPQETRSEFHARRAKGIGGSEVGAILGLDRFKTPMQLWEEKCGLVTPSDEMTPDQERGVVFEPIAIRRYETQNPHVSIVKQQWHGTHPDYPWMLFTLDGMVIDQGEEVPFEVKCPSLGMWARLRREGLPDSWALQGQHYLACTGYSVLRYIIFCADRMELMYFDVRRDDLTIDMIVEKEREFWMLVETGSPPPDIVAEIEGDKIVVVGEVTKRYDAEFEAVAKELKQAKELVKAAAEVEEDVKTRVLEVIGNKPGIYEAPGIGRIHYQQRAGRTSFDAKALAAVRPLDRMQVALAMAEHNLEDNYKFVDAVNEHCDLDLTRFEKQGKPFYEMRPYFGRGE